MTLPQLDADLAAVADEVIQLRRWFHRHPEPGFQEFKTAEKVEAWLKDLGLAPSRISGTGVVAVLDSGRPGPVLMLRADMDGLPVTETTGLAFASEHEGFMHACGHDAHMAMLLGAAKVLAGHREAFRGKIKFLFQPDEEVAGAARLVRDGILENPRVDAAMGIHIWSMLPSGRVSVSPGVVMGGLDVFKMTVKGRGGHTGYPHEAIDPVIAAAGLIQAVQAVQTREMDAQKPTIIMFGKLAAGKKSNIIPEEVYLEGTIRFLHDTAPDDPDTPTNRFIRICEAVCQAHRCTCTIDIEHENIPLVNDAGMAALAAGVAAEVFTGPEAVVPGRYIASEDFSEFTSRVPGVFTFLGCADPAKGTDFPHHNPRFDIDEAVLIRGVELHVKSALKFLEAD